MLNHLRLLVAIIVGLISPYLLTPSKAQRYCETTNIEQRQTYRGGSYDISVGQFLASSAYRSWQW